MKSNPRRFQSVSLRSTLSAAVLGGVLQLNLGCQPVKNTQSSTTLEASGFDTFLTLTRTAAESLASNLGSFGATTIKNLFFPNGPLATLSEASYKRIDDIVKKGVANEFLTDVQADWDGLQSMEIKGYTRSSTDLARSLGLVTQYCSNLARIIPKLKAHGIHGSGSLIQASAIYAALSEERIILLSLLGEKEEAKSRTLALQESMKDIGTHLQRMLDKANGLFEKELEEYKNTIPKANPRTGIVTTPHCLKIPNENVCFSAALEGQKGFIDKATAEVQKRRDDLKMAMGGDATLKQAIKGCDHWQNRRISSGVSGG